MGWHIAYGSSVGECAKTSEVGKRGCGKPVVRAGEERAGEVEGVVVSFWDSEANEGEVYGTMARDATEREGEGEFESSCVQVQHSRRA